MPACVLGTVFSLSLAPTYFICRGEMIVLNLNEASLALRGGSVSLWPKDCVLHNPCMPLCLSFAYQRKRQLIGWEWNWGKWFHPAAIRKSPLPFTQTKDSAETVLYNCSVCTWHRREQQQFTFCLVSPCVFMCYCGFYILGVLCHAVITKDNDSLSNSEKRNFLWNGLEAWYNVEETDQRMNMNCSNLFVKMF